MINGIRLKVCGLTTLVDAEAAGRIGADFLGFVLHPASPRQITLEQYRAMASRLPDRRKVAVMVEPGPTDLAAAAAAGFDRFQIHCRHDLPRATVAAWAETVSIARLWLAPRLPSGVEVPAEYLELAETFLLDTFDADHVGGTGRRGDWPQYRRHREAHPDKTWVLAGGLGPDNILEAVTATGAQFVDVNSGVESAPGVKDPARLEALRARLAAVPPG